MRSRLAIAALLVSSSALALEVPPVPTSYVSDYAGVLGATGRAQVEEKLAAIERSSGHQVVAAFFPSLEGEPLEDFTIRCAERWRVGRKGLDDGVIFFAFVNDRRMRLEVGYGLEGKIPDAIARRLLDNTVRPAFARGDYAGGVVALAADLSRIFAGDRPSAVVRRHRQDPGPFLIIVLFVVIGLLRRLMGGRRLRGRRGYWGPFWGGGFGGGGFGGGFGGGGFSAGGGSFGGGGASGSW
jgi:uncharacterized protein